MMTEERIAQYVLTVPGTLSASTIASIRDEVIAALETGRPIVLSEGAMLYDANHAGQPLPMVTTDATIIEWPWWVLPFAIIALCALVSIAINTAS